MAEQAKVDATIPTDATAIAAAEAAKVVETQKVADDVAAKAKLEADAVSQGLKDTETKSLMDDAVSKEATEAEEKRLLETPIENLSDEDKIKRGDLEKAKEAADKVAKDKAVPEKYVFKVPEGMTMDQEYADKASVIMKKHGVTQACATELGEMAAAQISKITAEKSKADEANFKSFVEGLRKETVETLQKEGKNPQLELTFAAKTRDRLAPPGFIDVLNKSGLADDVNVVKFFISLGKSISEGKLVEGANLGSGEKNPLDTLYPTTVVK